MKLDDSQTDTLTEIINIGVGRAAAVLNEMVGSHVLLNVPSLKVVAAKELNGFLLDFPPEAISVVQMPFEGSFEGTASLVFPQESASLLVVLLTGEDINSPDLGSLRVETLNEVGNIIINAVMGSIGNIADTPLEYRVPHFTETIMRALLEPHVPKGSTILIARTQFTVAEHNIEGNILIIFEVGSFESLLTIIDSL